MSVKGFLFANLAVQFTISLDKVQICHMFRFVLGSFIKCLALY